MRSDKVVLPESMCAEMPMLRMRSMFATSVSALLDFSLEQAPREREFPSGSRVSEPRSLPRNGGNGKQAALRPFRRSAPRCSRDRWDAARRRGLRRAGVPRLTVHDPDREAPADRHPPPGVAEEGV